MEGQRKRSPRVRKTAPMVREKADLARQAANKRKPRRLRNAVLAPIKAVSLPDNVATRPVRKAGGLIAKFFRFITPSYFVNSWREVRQVTWPSRKETWRLTGAVFVFAILFGVVVAGVDKGLDELFKRFILK